MSTSNMSAKNEGNFKPMRNPFILLLKVKATDSLLMVKRFFQSSFFDRLPQKIFKLSATFTSPSSNDFLSPYYTFFGKRAPIYTTGKDVDDVVTWEKLEKVNSSMGKIMSRIIMYGTGILTLKAVTHFPVIFLTKSKFVLL